MTCKNVMHSPRTNNAPRILVVEADDDTRLMLKYLLEIWQYQVIESPDGQAALNRAAEPPPDLILLNTDLPDIAGQINGKWMREISTNARSKIIFVSSRIDAEFRACALAEGFCNFLVKPIDFGELEKILDECLRETVRNMTAPVTEVIL